MVIKTNSDSGKFRHLAGATAFSMAVLSGSVYGLGLGSIELGSTLNQPFSAEIEVITDVPGEAADLAVQLASQEAFMRAGIDRPQSLSKLSFSLSKRDGRSFIRVSSDDPIVEPFLNFLVEVDWDRGSLVREYTVLLDPPSYVNATPSTTVLSELVEVSDDAVADPSLPSRIDRAEETVSHDYTTTALSEDELAAELAAVNEALSGPTASSTGNNSSNAVVATVDPLLDELREVDDLLVVADNSDFVLPPQQEASASETSVVAAAELAEIDDDVIYSDSESASGIETFSTASAPTEERLYTETAVDDMDALVAALDRELLGESTQVSKALAPSAAEDATDSASGKTLAPVRRGQTLWSIASANRVPGVTVEQMMVALLRTNPNAFEDGNINALNRGAILRVPTASEVANMDSKTALTSVNEQNALWKKYRDQARAKPAEAQPGESAGTPAPTANAEPENTEGTLKLVAETEQAKVGEKEQIEANTAVDGEIQAQMTELRNQLNLAQEEAETERQRAEEMGSRVTDLESAIEKMNTLLSLRNAEMAKLQASVLTEKEQADAAAAKQIADAQAAMQQQLEQAKSQAQQEADEATARQQASEQELASLRAQLEAATAASEAAQGAAEEARALAAAEEAKAQAAVEEAQARAAAEEAKAQAAIEEAEARAAAEEAKAQAAIEQAEARVAAEGAKAQSAVEEAEAMVAAQEAKAQAEAEAERLAAEAEAAKAQLLAAEQQAAQEAEEAAANAKAEAPWYEPYMTAENAKYAGICLLGLIGLGFFAFRGKKPKEEEHDLFAEGNYEHSDDTHANATNAYEEAEEAYETGDDVTAYGHTAIADELNDETVDATDLTALDATLNEEAPAAGNVDILQEADVYLSYGLSDRAEELLDGAIAADPNDGMLQAKRLEALFVKQDGVSFETAALSYHDKFGGDDAPHWPKIASWGAALAPLSNLFSGAEPANLDETQDITSLDTTKLAGDGGLDDAGGLAATIEDNASAAVDSALDAGAEIGDGLSITSTELEHALDSTAGSVSALGDDLSETAAESYDTISEIGGDVSSELNAELGTGIEEMEATASSLGDDLDSMSAGLEDDLEMTDLESTLAGDGDIQEMLDATGADEFELAGVEDGTGTGDGGLADEIGLSDLESELLGTDGTGSLGGLSEEVDFEAAGLSLGDETTEADMTVTGDEVDTMLDLARAYIDMGDSDSASSTISEIISTGNADQVEAAKELQAQMS